MISLDLPWKDAGTGNCVAAYVTGRGSVAWITLSFRSGLDVDAIRNWLVGNAAPNALVLLDIPIGGCERLRAGEHRPLELRLKRQQMDVLPAGNAGTLGRKLEELILETVPGACILESHPYLPLPDVDPKVVEEIFRQLVLRQLHRAKRLSQEFLRSLLGWRRSGFSAHGDETIEADDRASLGTDPLGCRRTPPRYSVPPADPHGPRAGPGPLHDRGGQPGALLEPTRTPGRRKPAAESRSRAVSVPASLDGNTYPSFGTR